MVSGSNYAVNRIKQQETEEDGTPLITYFALITACSTSMSMAQCGAWTSPVLAALPVGAVNDVVVDSLLPAAAAVGVIIGWIIVEISGRKLALMLSGVLFLVGWALVGCAQAVHLTLIYPGRFVSGLAAGIVNIASTIYIAEISPPDLRGSMYALAQVFTNLGLLVEYLAGAYIDYLGLVLVSSVHPLLFLISTLFIPESPYYLLRADRVEEAEAVLKRLRRNSTEAAAELKEIQINVENRGSWWRQGQRIGRSKANMRALAVCVGANIARQMTGGHAILSYAHTIFYMAGVATSPHIASIILASVKTLSSSLTTTLTSHFGIKKLLVFSCAGVTLMLAGLSAYFFVHESHVHLAAAWNWFPLVVVILYFTFQDFGINPFPSFIGAEIFRGEVKGLGTGICQCAGFIANTMTISLVTGIDLRISLAIFAVCTLISTPLLNAYLKDTHGMSLQEAQEHIYHKDATHHI